MVGAKGPPIASNESWLRRVFGGLLSLEIATFSTLLVIVGVMVYSWFIITVTLEVPSGSAVAVVVLDFLVSLFLQGLSDKMLLGQ